MSQVVVWRDAYGTETYLSDEDIQVLEFDTERYEDEIPDEWALLMFKRDIDKVTIPEAKEALMHWYNENYQWRENIKRETIEASERLQREQKEQDKLVLEKYGIDTSIVET